MLFRRDRYDRSNARNAVEYMQNKRVLSRGTNIPLCAEVDCTRGIPPISPTGEKLSLYFPPCAEGVRWRCRLCETMRRDCNAEKFHI